MRLVSKCLMPVTLCGSKKGIVDAMIATVQGGQIRREQTSLENAIKRQAISDSHPCRDSFRRRCQIQEPSGRPVEPCDFTL